MYHWIKNRFTTRKNNTNNIRLTENGHLYPENFEEILNEHINKKIKKECDHRKKIYSNYNYNRCRREIINRENKKREEKKNVKQENNFEQLTQNQIRSMYQPLVLKQLGSNTNWGKIKSNQNKNSKWSQLLLHSQKKPSHNNLEYENFVIKPGVNYSNRFNGGKRKTRKHNKK